MHKFITGLSLLFLVGLFTAANGGTVKWSLPVINKATVQRAGDPVSIEKIGGYSKIAAKLVVWWAGMSEKIPIDNGIDLYRITYLTVDDQQMLVDVSGLLSVPRTSTTENVISWQHGTALNRQQAPSTPTPDEGVLVSLAFSGSGAILLAPDYIGFGVSKNPHPYYHLPTTVGATRDLLKAAKILFMASGRKFPGNLFLAGFSQGGHATMAITRELERAPITDLKLIAAASIAGPIDLAGFSFLNSLEGKAESASMYLAYILNSYARIYSHNISDVFREPYDRLIPLLFDGETAGKDVMAQLPRNPKSMLKEAFMSEYPGGKTGWVGQRLSENALVNWIPKTPLRLYFGTNDVDVSHTEALTWSQHWQNEGAPALAVNVGPKDHNESVIEAAPRIRDWFAEF